MNYSVKNYKVELKFGTKEKYKIIKEITHRQCTAYLLVRIIALTTFIITAHIPAAPGSVLIYSAARTPIGLLTLQVRAILAFCAIQLPNFHTSLELKSRKWRARENK